MGSAGVIRATEYADGMGLPSGKSDGPSRGGARSGEPNRIAKEGTRIIPISEPSDSEPLKHLI